VQLSPSFQGAPGMVYVHCADEIEIGVVLMLTDQCMTLARYYTRVWEMGALGEQKVHRGCMRNARLGGHNG